MRNIILILVLLFSPGLSKLSFTQEQDATIVTYYPAPFGDFENVRSNNLEIFGTMSLLNGAADPPTAMNHFDHLPIHRGIRVLNEITEVYGAGNPTVAAVQDYIELGDNHLHFNEEGGVFFRNDRNGMVYDFTAPNTNRLALRTSGDIYLQPGEDDEVVNEGFVDKSTDGVLSGNVFVQSDMQVQQNLSVENNLNVNSGNINAAAGKIQEAGNDLLPSGTIVMWSGGFTNIPAGWALCNGTNGTPDLRDQFIRGSSSAANHNTAGASFSNHEHTLNTSISFDVDIPLFEQSISINSAIPQTTYTDQSLYSDTQGFLYRRKNTLSIVRNTYFSGAINVDIDPPAVTVNPTVNAQIGGPVDPAGGGTQEYIPAHYRLAFIMKL